MSVQRFYVEELERRELLSGYTFTQVSETKPWGSFNPLGPAINDNGDVAYLSAGLVQEIVVADGNTTTRIADTNGTFSQFQSFLSINDSGTVSFFAELDGGGFGVFAGDGSSITPIITDPGPSCCIGIHDVSSINNQGLVAFSAVVDGVRGIFVGDGTTTTAIVTDGGSFTSFSGGPSLNDAGYVAFIARLDTGETGVFSNHGGSIVTIDVPAGVSQGPSMNNLGAVAFLTTGQDGPGISVGDGGPVTTIATGFPFSSRREPSINDDGTIAFWAKLSNGDEVILTGPDLVADRFIGTGDVLLGKTIEDVAFWREGLNNAGQFAFYAGFDDGTSAIFRADPEPPPPPSTSLPAVVDGNVWHLRDSLTSGSADSTFIYGMPGDLPLVGDWDGNGTMTPGVFRNGLWFLRNSNTSGFADVAFAYGMPGDKPVVGDWDADGIDTPGVMRDGLWFLRNSNSTGPGEIAFFFGTAGDTPVVGDWDDDGVDTPGVFREGTWFLRNSNSTGIGDIALAYGEAGDLPVTGDWDGDGIDTVGVVRGDLWFLRNTNTTGQGDLAFEYDSPIGTPLAWFDEPTPSAELVDAVLGELDRWNR